MYELLAWAHIGASRTLHSQIASFMGLIHYLPFAYSIGGRTVRMNIEDAAFSE